MTPQTLPARTLNEVRCYFLVTPCQACGKGPLHADLPSGSSYQGPLAVAARCPDCAASEESSFDIERGLPADPPRSELISLSDEPSRIIDLAGWGGLFYMFLSAADRQSDRIAIRRLGHQAALCLVEALKFYEDDELPPPSAFFHDLSRTAFHEHPQKFARQRLLDMKAKLPSLASMEHRLEQDQARQRQSWWQRLWER